MKLTDTPKPDFIDHFPQTAPGHGMAGHLNICGEDGKVVARTKAKPCVEPGCALNRHGNGSLHSKGRSDNAASWMRDVGYNGPSPGIRAAEDRPEREERPINPRLSCHKLCKEKGPHSQCLPASIFRVGVGDRMAERVGDLSFTSERQEQRRLAEYLGVERSWRGEERRAS